MVVQSKKENQVLTWSKNGPVIRTVQDKPLLSLLFKESTIFCLPPKIGTRPTTSGLAVLLPYSLGIKRLTPAAKAASIRVS